MKTIIVKVTKDEWYPIYEIDLEGLYTDSKLVGLSLEIPEEKLNEYKVIMGKFNQMQKYLEKLYDKRFDQPY